MPFVVAEPCIKCKYTDCVDACPVECFFEGENMLVIDPEICIDCGACVPACPTEACFDVEKLPKKWEEYVELNRRLSQEWPLINKRQKPLPTADESSFETDKRRQLSEKPAPR